MGRSFRFEYRGRWLDIRPVPVDEGWDLWLMDGERRLTCGGHVSIDDAVIAKRSGQDLIQCTAEQIRERLVSAGF